MRCLRLMLLLWLAAPGAVAAEEPSAITVIGWAHYFMIGRLAHLANASFGPAVVHPQPGGRYWAVVGEVASGALTGNMAVQSYVAAVRQVCGDAEASECWRLEKLAVEGRILFDRGQTL